MRIPFKRYGGKGVISQWIIPYLPPHRIYVEPFCGSAAVLFKKHPSPVEVINDLDARLINAFRQLRSKPEILAALLWATPISPVDLQGPKNEKISSDDPMEDARLFISQSMQFFSSPHESRTWGIKDESLSNQVANWWTRIKPAAERLRRVQILQKDAVEVIERFDKFDDVLFYVDPPYAGHEDEYSIKVDYDRLAKVLKASKNKVIVSDFEARQPIWEGEGWYSLSKEFTRVAGSRQKGKKKPKNREFLFLNFPPPYQRPRRKGFGLCSKMLFSPE